MAVNKTAGAWPDERLSDLDHDNCIIKIIKPDYVSLNDHILDPEAEKALYSDFFCIFLEVFALYNELAEWMQPVWIFFSCLLRWLE